MRLRMAVLVVLVSVGTCHADAWTKYVAADKSYSFHYPTGWKVTAQGAIVTVDAPKTGEQLLLVLTGVEAGQTARDVAQKVVEALQQGVPDLQVAKWSDLPEDGKSAAASITYTQDNKPFLGALIVAVHENTASSLGYSAPQDEFAELRAHALLSGFASSFATGDGSVAPQGKVPDLASGLLDRDAGAFVFVLEFGCRVAFSQAQEKAVRAEIVKGWRQLSPAARTKLDAWPQFMKTILSLTGTNATKVQAEIEKLTQDALANSDSDPAARALRDAIAASRKVVTEGDPPLTAGAADAYAELAAFASLFADNHNAGPENISAKTVEGDRAALLKAWPKATKVDKQTVLGSPALWSSMRMTFQEGTAAEKETVRRQISAMVAYGVSLSRGGSSGASGGTSGKPMDWATFNCLQAMKQTTFNTYMWSQHFQGWTPMGKSW